MHIINYLIGACALLSGIAAQPPEKYPTTTSFTIITAELAPTKPTTITEPQIISPSGIDSIVPGTVTEQTFEVTSAPLDTFSIFLVTTSTTESSTANTTATEPPEYTHYKDTGGDHVEMLPIELTPEDTVSISTIQVEAYTDFLATIGPLEVYEGQQPAPIVLPNCPPANLTAKIEKRIWPFKDHPKPPAKKPKYNCSPSTLNIEIYWQLPTKGLYITFPRI